MIVVTRIFFAVIALLSTAIVVATIARYGQVIVSGICMGIGILIASFLAMIFWFKTIDPD